MMWLVKLLMYSKREPQINGGKNSIHCNAVLLTTSAPQSTLTTSLCNIARFQRVSVCLLRGRCSSVQPCSYWPTTPTRARAVRYFDYALWGSV